MPLASAVPPPHPLHLSSRGSLQQTSLYFNWPAVCYVTACQREKARLCQRSRCSRWYVGGGRDLNCFLNGGGAIFILGHDIILFHQRSRLLSTTCVPQLLGCLIMWFRVPVHMDYLSASVSFYPPSCCRSNPRFRSITLMQCVSVCFCVERFTQTRSHKHMQNVSCSDEYNH